MDAIYRNDGLTVRGVSHKMDLIPRHTKGVYSFRHSAHSCVRLFTRVRMRSRHYFALSLFALVRVFCSIHFDMY